MVHLKEYLEDLTPQDNVDDLFDGILLRQEYWNVLGHMFGSSVESYKGSKYANLDGSVVG